MDKKDLLTTLILARDLEENHSATITKFFLDDFDWSGYDRTKVNIVHSILETIDADSRRHADMLNDIIRSIERGKKDDI